MRSLVVFGLVCMILESVWASYPIKSSTWTKTELFFGLSIQEDLGNGTVKDSVISFVEFESFIDTYITPVFPDGLTYLNSSGQWLSSTGVLVTEPSIYMIVYYEDTSINEENIQQIIGQYMELYNQEAVLYSFMPARVCSTPDYCLSTETTYHSPFTLVAFLLGILNTLVLIILIALGIYHYRGMRNYALTRSLRD